MGSTSIMALLIQSHVTTMGVGASVFMSLIGGIIILLLGLINLGKSAKFFNLPLSIFHSAGFVFEFFSYPVMAGFTSAAAFTIASSQIKNFLGIAGQATGFLQSWQSVVGEAHKISKWDTILGVVSLSILFLLKVCTLWCKFCY
jgi:sodium-independent sulfate anion transporter 11